MPNRWEYIRLSHIAYLGAGFTPAQSNISQSGTIPYFKVSDMNTIGNEKYISVTKQFYVGDKSKKVFPKNTIIFPKNGGAVFTNKKRILAQDSVVDLNTGAFIPYGLIDTEYAYVLFSTIDFREHYKGTALPTIDTEFMNNLIFGLPPVEEQKRIVAKIEKFEPLIAEYDKLEQQATRLDSEIYDKLKKSILQYAIQGKLVPQDKNDEPASELLKRIRAEKKAQLGKKYVESYIFKGDDNCYYEKVGSETKNITDEIPFDIPDSWIWCRLNQLIDFSKNISTPANEIKDSAWILDLEDIEKESGRLLTKKRMRDIKSKSDKHKFAKGNVLYSKLRPYLNKVIVADENGYCTSEILVFNFEPIYNLYAQAFLMSQYFVDYAMAGAYGVKMPRIGSERGNNALMPLPPLEEQKRIVNAINDIFFKIKGEN